MNSVLKVIALALVVTGPARGRRINNDALAMLRRLRSLAVLRWEARRVEQATVDRARFSACCQNIPSVLVALMVVQLGR